MADLGLQPQSKDNARKHGQSFVAARPTLEERFAAVPGPWEWDLKGLVASAAVVARHMGGKEAGAAAAARCVTQSYRPHIRDDARMGCLDTGYAAIGEKNVLAAVSEEARRRAEKVMAKTRQRTPIQVLDKIADLVDGPHRIVEQRPFIVRETHAGHGQPAREALDDGDPLFLQIKQVQASVLQPHAPRSLPFANAGQRVMVGQRMIQGSPDILLGWCELGSVQFYVRPLRDMKGSAEFRQGRTDLDTLPDNCRLCGRALALAHAKSDDAAVIAGYVGKTEVLDDALAGFALAYADQTERDYELLVKAVQGGRIALAQGHA